MKKIAYLYWLIPLVLWILQLIFTFNSFSQLRYEEVANSVRNPYWLSHRTVYGGASSNVGWEGFLAIIYSLFGFSLFTGKYIRLILHLVSLFALAAILKKYLGSKLALIPLVTIGLSPTWLFFNTLAAQYAIDLDYLPIILFLLLSPTSLFRVSGWVLSMIAWMSYPPFMFYLPALGAIYLWRWRWKVKDLILSISAFLSPLIAVFIYVQNRQSLINDPIKGNSGIFRGGGGQFPPGPGTIDLNLKNLSSDLFGQGVSYNFNLHLGEFSLVFPVLVLFLVLIFGVILFKYPKTRFVTFWLWLVFVFDLIIYTFVQDLTGLPGVRRITGMLAAFYGLFTLVWYFSLARSKGITLVIILILLPLHHLIVYPLNLAHLKDPSVLKDATGFFEVAKTPEESLQVFLDKLQKEDVYLKCQMMTAKGEVVNMCRYGEMYAALAGSCLWNHLSCHKVYGYDWNSEKYILLENRLWDENIFEP